MMKISLIIKRACTILLSVLCAFCCFLTPVTSIALAVEEAIETSSDSSGAASWSDFIERNRQFEALGLPPTTLDKKGERKLRNNIRNR